MGRPGHALMPAGIDPFEQRRVAFGQECDCLLPRALELRAFPNLIEAAGITTIALAEVAATNAHPPRYPDIDSVGFGEAMRLDTQGMGRHLSSNELESYLSLAVSGDPSEVMTVF
jgi:hypothetical protein